jgi:hypothetical protein
MSNSWGAPLQPVKVETYFTTLTIVLAEQTQMAMSNARVGCMIPPLQPNAELNRADGDGGHGGDLC